MTEEIKEILDIFTKYKDNWYSVEYILKPKQCVMLLDYITNLQQLYENGLKVNQNSHKYITELEMNNAILKEDLDKSNDTIEKDRQFYKCRMDEYAELKKENERLKEEKQRLLYNLEKVCEEDDEVYQERDIYKSRCRKAIEYIDVHTLFVNGPIIKSILNGSGENE